MTQITPEQLAAILTGAIAPLLNQLETLRAAVQQLKAAPAAPVNVPLGAKSGGGLTGLARAIAANGAVITRR